MARAGAHVGDGRFAPSPTGPLHLGNLRTALIAWVFARSAGGRFVLRVEDLDVVASRREHEESHRHDLAAIGLDWDGPVVRQSERFELYRSVLDDLQANGLLYPCYCTRKEVQAAVRAEHGPRPEGAYPGTCRTLAARERAEREAAGRAPAVRLRSEGATAEFDDVLVGPVSGVVDDFVVQRNDGAPAYNLAVVVDDHLQDLDEVVRGDDLLSTTPRQVHLSRLLGWDVPRYAHVPLVLGPDGERLAKRHGAVTLADREAEGITAIEVRDELVGSLGRDVPIGGPSLDPVIEWFRPERLDPTQVLGLSW